MNYFLYTKVRKVIYVEKAFMLAIITFLVCAQLQKAYS